MTVLEAIQLTAALSGTAGFCLGVALTCVVDFFSEATRAIRRRERQ